MYKNVRNYVLLDTPVRPYGMNTTYITRFSEPLTAVMVSHFLIDLHKADKRMTHQTSFLTLDVMSRLETPESILFHEPFGRNDTSGASTDDYGMDTMNSYSV
ncbi:hypothetical protein BD311DRAFT_740443 [Dichomitus squalens]|uniref:Uncharacterized protein n=1 Tax=Dichomitus squalens TaxID=114155 RepID=A0A4Q9MKU5_9APHY|nr:hypothetical protein BD311DRAFT_740443 [Dichomitus squalens]